MVMKQVLIAEDYQCTGAQSLAYIRNSKQNMRLGCLQDSMHAARNNLQ